MGQSVTNEQTQICTYNDHDSSMQCSIRSGKVELCFYVFNHKRLHAFHREILTSDRQTDEDEHWVLDEIKEEGEMIRGKKKEQQLRNQEQ